MAKCYNCSTEFNQKRHNQLYCSNECKRKRNRTSAYPQTLEQKQNENDRKKRYRERKKEEQKKYHDKTRFGGNREAVLQRDNHQCCVCGTKDQLVVHHKDRTGQTENPNNDMSNLITLCASCHQEEHKSDWVRVINVKECQHCGKSIDERSWEDRKFCSKSCNDKSLIGKYRTSMQTNCEVCNASFLTTPYKLSIGKGKYCSTECSITAQTKTIHMECLICKNTFETIPAKIKAGKGKYCSKECYGISKRGSKPDDTIKVCFTCKGVFPRTSERFHSHNVNKDGFNGSCKICVSMKQKQARIKKN